MEQMEQKTVKELIALLEKHKEEKVLIVHIADGKQVVSLLGFTLK